MERFYFWPANPAASLFALWVLSQIFLYAALVLILALIVSVFLDDVPLRGRQRAAEEDAPVVAA